MITLKLYTIICVLYATVSVPRHVTEYYSGKRTFSHSYQRFRLSRTKSGFVLSVWASIRNLVKLPHIPLMLHENKHRLKPTLNPFCFILLNKNSLS